MSFPDTNNGWSDLHSFINEIYNEHDLLTVRGLFFYHGAEFRFSLTQQTKGRYVMRGTVSVISPADGAVLQLKGREKSEITKKLSVDYIARMEGKRLPELNLSAAIYCTSLEIEQIKAAIQKSALRLYKGYAAQIHRALGEVARPDTITPSIAAHKFVDRYLEKNHPNLNTKSCETYRGEILDMCSAMPHIPMKDYSVSTLKKWAAWSDLSNHRKELLRKFWMFCIDSKVCIGKSPFPPKEKKIKSSDTAIEKMGRLSILTIEQQDALFELMIRAPTGADCGVALKLWGNYNFKTACSFKWSDVIFASDHDDYVRIKYSRTDLAGATHSYICPLFPAGALILQKRYNELRKIYDEDAIGQMPIVSQAKSPGIGLTPSALTQTATMRLHSIGLTYENLHALHKNNKSVAVSNLILENTYAYCVYVLCDLDDEPGTAKFLLHESLAANVTDDHYTSFTSDEAGERLHTIMSFVIPDSPIEEVISPISMINGKTKYSYVPETTRQRVGLVDSYILQPGEELIIKCRHGVTGSASVRALNSDGTLRRKTRKKNILDN